MGLVERGKQLVDLPLPTVFQNHYAFVQLRKGIEAHLSLVKFVVNFLYEVQNDAQLLQEQKRKGSIKKCSTAMKESDTKFESIKNFLLGLNANDAPAVQEMSMFKCCCAICPNTRYRHFHCNKFRNTNGSDH